MVINLTPPFKVVCIDDTNRPAEVPLSQWIKKDETYTVIEVSKCLSQGGVIGYKLEEVEINAARYLYFAAFRFAPMVLMPTEAVEAEEEMVV